MELGIHLGDRKHRRKRTLILDAESHRYDRSSSDISAHGITAHANEPDEIIRCVRDWLSKHRPARSPPLPGAAAIRGDYRRFLSDVGAISGRFRLDPVDGLTYSDFLFAVRDWVAAVA